MEGKEKVEKKTKRNTMRLIHPLQRESQIRGRKEKGKN